METKAPTSGQARDSRSSSSATQEDIPPSIFNDVIGPVMRGPSSSHCAAALRIGRLARDLMDGEIRGVLVEFHPDGSLATTHQSQGSDMGLFGGLLGWDATHDDLVGSGEAIREAGIDVEIRITDFPAVHPNTYRLSLRSGCPGEEEDSWSEDGSFDRQMVAVSTGGGMVRVVEVDGIPVSMRGDAYETLVFLDVKADGEAWAERLKGRLLNDLEADEVFLRQGEAGGLIQIRSREPLSTGKIWEALDGEAVAEISTMAPVLPVLSGRGRDVPFTTAAEALEFAGDSASDRVEARPDGVETRPDGVDARPDLADLAIEYEAIRGGIPHDEVVSRMESLIRIMADSVALGLEGTDYWDRILPAQAKAFKERLEAGELLDGGILNQALLYVTAIMEVKSSMGVVVAAPTAGSCGALPATVLAAGQALGRSEREMARAMLAAGLVGVFVAAGATFAAEECGCQAECGAGSGMAAAALVTLVGGSPERALAAASLAMQNTLGMICDPVANRVEVPCLGRNSLAASNALASANLALAGFDEVIPLDEVIGTMADVGRALPKELRCTALGGLSVTDASRRIQEELDGRRRGG